MVEWYVTAVRSVDGGSALWHWHAVMFCRSSCLAIIRVLGQSCCQHFPWYTLSCYTHFCQAVLPWSGCAVAVVPRCCCHAALPLCMLLTAVHVAYLCSAAFPLSYSLANNTDSQFYRLCHSRSAFHCLTTLPLSSYFCGIILLCQCHMA